MSRDDAGLLYFYVLTPLVIVTLGVLAFTKRSFASWAALALFGACVYFMARNTFQLRSLVRWSLASKSYRSAILSQVPSADGQLRHAEWDGWGFAGAGDTTVYVVFDPDNLLARAATSHQPGRYPGLPCDVYSVGRLEDGWYYVWFYTDTGWAS